MFSFRFKKRTSGDNLTNRGGKNMTKWLYVTLTLLLVLGCTWWTEQKQVPLNENVLRLHVVANSDDPADQALKLAVKDRVVKLMREEFKSASSMPEARQLALQSTDTIEVAAAQVVAAHGYDYPVQVAVGEFQFPTKSYGNLVLPQGDYQAVRVVIGAGEGKNWWCVLFPPLCMVSSSDQGLSLGTTEEAEVSFKCLELLAQGAHLGKPRENKPR